MKLIGQIDRIIFEDDGFFIGLLDSGEKISGHYHDSSLSSIEKAAVTLEGEFTEHPKYGKTFRFHTLSVNQHELFFFLNRVVKGFPKKVTVELIERFGEAGLVDILDHDIERLTEFSGIKAKKLERIQSRWKQFRSMRELGSFLAPYHVSPALLTTIAGAMKEASDPVAAIKRNPYILSRIEGIGFKRADAVALKMGMAHDDERRIACAMEYVVTQRCERAGNSCVEKLDLFDDLSALVGDATLRPRFEAVLADEVAEGTIHVLGADAQLLSPKRLYEAERFIFDELRRRSKHNHEPLVADLDAFLAASAFTPGAQQRQAIETLNSGVRSLCLVGYAGTGKSTTSRLLLELLCTRCSREEIITCALSGIASQRIAEVTGFESATIQSLLVRFDERDVMPYKVVLIDEASMINAFLFARLLRKCHRDATIIVVGDDAQLPPIGAGDVLGDIIRFRLMPIVTLTKIYRQSEEQAIAVIADAIRKGIPPDVKRTYCDFHFQAIELSSGGDGQHHADAILHAVAEAAIEVIPEARILLKNKALYEYLTCFQVISPMKGGTLGTENLNRVLQAYFNPSPKQKVERGGQIFALMDKVVHIKNDNLSSWSLQGYKDEAEPETRRIYNGMLGLLFRIDEEAQQLFVVYPLEEVVVCYDFSQVASYLMLAYCLTIHKVQGMEYRRVVMPVSSAHTVMLNKKLLYTAVTRAKEHLALVGDERMLARAVQRKDADNRMTVMQYLVESES